MLWATWSSWRCYGTRQGFGTFEGPFQPKAVCDPVKREAMHCGPLFLWDLWHSPLSASPDKPYRRWAVLRQCQWVHICPSGGPRQIPFQILSVAQTPKIVCFAPISASTFLLMHNVRSQKCEVENITSAFSALDYFILPLLVIFSGKSVPLQVTGTYLFPIFLFVLPLFLVMRILRQKLLVVWRLQLHIFITWIVFGRCKVCLTVLR